MNLRPAALGIVAVLATIAGEAAGQPRKDGRATSEEAPAVARRFDDFKDAAASPVEPFAYTIAVESDPNIDYGMPWQEITLTVRSTETVRGDDSVGFVEVSVRHRPGLLDMTAKEVEFVVRNDDRRKPAPAHTAYIRLRDLHMPADRPTYIRLRFRGADEYFALTFQRGRGLRLVPVKSRFGLVKGGRLADYDIRDVTEGTRLYRCDNQGIVAHDGAKELWNRRIPLKGAPKEFRVVGDTLFVSSTGGHSLYVRKRDGKIVYYHEGVLAGKDPWAEVLELARERYRRAEKDSGANLYQAIGAAALLNDKRAAPFLIECLDKGYGLSEKWWAVAALETLNGDPRYWKAMREGQPWDPASPDEPTEGMDENRVYKNLAAEVRKWEKVFGKVEKRQLTRGVK
jgi:hypothetical protein